MVDLHKIDCEVDEARGETLDRGSVIDIVVAIELVSFVRSNTESKDNIIE